MTGVTYRICKNRNIWEVWKATWLVSRRVAWALSYKDAVAIMNQLATNDVGEEF
jgi:hypothetical protein